MNASPENDPAKSAQKRLKEACRLKDTSLRLAWTITIGEALLLAACVLALVDYWLMLPVWLRSVGALGLAALATLGIIRLVRFYQRPTRLKEAALDIEATKPELGCEISTAAEYWTGERKPVHEYEPELAAALQAKAARHLSAPATVVPYEKKMVRPAVVFAATFLLILIGIAIAPVALTALQRTALPFSDARYTQVQVKPGNVEIPIGTDVAVTNIFSGRMPQDPRLHWQHPGKAEPQTVALAKTGDGAYVHVFKQVRSNLTYQVTGSDAISEPFQIKTYVPPEVKELGIQIRYPEYTKRTPSKQTAPEIAAVRASSAEFHIQPTVALVRAKLKFSALPEVALLAGPDGSWSGNFKITKDSDYWIELADQKGHLGVNDKPYHIKALPDNPPKVEITDPGKDIRAAATNKIPIKISASDDFGVADVQLVFHKLGASEQVISAQRESEHNGEVIASAELDLSTLSLREYELVAYHARASDNNTLDGPGVGKSPVYFVEITNEEGKPCLSQCQNQKVNLLVIQKQIIADTTALAANASAEKFDEMNARQGDAADFGRMYAEALSSGAAPEAAAPAAQEMEAAIKEMENAKSSLAQRNRAEALPHEESALAHLYQVVKQMPELQDLPTTPPTAKQKPPPNPKLKVVLEAIKQKKKERPDNQELEAALNEAINLTRSQSGFNAGAARHANEGGGKGQGQGQAKDQAKGQTQGQGQGKSGAAKAQGQGNAQGQGQGKGSSQDPANGNDSENENSANPEQNSPPEEPAQLAEKETQLSQAAAVLAEKLQRLAGKDSRLGHNAGNGAARASGKMAAAAKAMGNGGFGAAGEQGFQGELALRRVIAQLERILKNQPEPTDIANEDYPKEYEGVISEYLKKLSHAE